VVDSQWKYHLLFVGPLKEGIVPCRLLAQYPIVEFKRSIHLFEDMMARIANETIRYLFHIQVPAGRAAALRRVAPQPRLRGANAPAADGRTPLSLPLRASSEPQHLPAVAR